MQHFSKSKILELKTTTLHNHIKHVPTGSTSVTVIVSAKVWRVAFRQVVRIGESEKAWYRAIQMHAENSNFNGFANVHRSYLCIQSFMPDCFARDLVGALSFGVWIIEPGLKPACLSLQTLWSWLGAFWEGICFTSGIDNAFFWPGQPHLRGLHIKRRLFDTIMQQRVFYFCKQSKCLF